MSNAVKALRETVSNAAEAFLWGLAGRTGKRLE